MDARVSASSDAMVPCSASQEARQPTRALALALGPVAPAQVNSLRTPVASTASQAAGTGGGWLQQSKQEVSALAAVVPSGTLVSVCGWHSFHRSACDVSTG